MILFKMAKFELRGKLIVSSDGSVGYGGTHLSVLAFQAAAEDREECDVNTQMVVQGPHVDVQMVPFSEYLCPNRFLFLLT